MGDIKVGDVISVAVDCVMLFVSKAAEAITTIVTTRKQEKINNNELAKKVRDIWKEK